MTTKSEITSAVSAAFTEVAGRPMTSPRPSGWDSPEKAALEAVYSFVSRSTNYAKAESGLYWGEKPPRKNKEADYSEEQVWAIFDAMSMILTTHHGPRSLMLAIGLTPEILRRADEIVSKKS